ncbi:MAG: methylated-DNA--[Thermoguttaceae bacterium]|nr:methylated-DNA--[protein]-cysteine S-methyltransferase [Thermoguttaceae bacterium]
MIDDCLNSQNWHIVIKDNAVVELNYSANDCIVVSELSQDCSTALEREARRQLEEYFAGQRQTFDLPLRPQGTDFQRRVWKELLHIPYGQTATYGQIAHRIGNPNAARAVGQACNANLIPIFIPCHRVVGSYSRLTGFALGLDVKTVLLELERETLF